MSVVMSLGTKIAIVVVVIIIVILLLGALGNSTTKVYTASVFPNGTVYSMPPNGYQVVGFTLNYTTALVINFKAQGGAVTGYILNPQQYSNFTTKTSPTAQTYKFTTGQVTQGSINTNLPAGTFYLIFASDSQNQTAVTIINASAFKIG
jgi:hypothetical protein